MDSLDRLTELAEETRQHSERLSSLELPEDPSEAVNVLRSEIVDTIAPLFSDFSSTVVDFINETNEDDGEDDDDLESVLLPQDADEFTSLFGLMIVLVEKGIDEAPNDDARREMLQVHGSLQRATQRVKDIRVDESELTGDDADVGDEETESN